MGLQRPEWTVCTGELAGSSCYERQERSRVIAKEKDVPLDADPVGETKTATNTICKKTFSLISAVEVDGQRTWRRRAYRVGSVYLGPIGLQPWRQEWRERLAVCLYPF